MHGVLSTTETLYEFLMRHLRTAFEDSLPYFLESLDLIESYLEHAPNSSHILKLVKNL
jgi:hypothetical protein